MSKCRSPALSMWLRRQITPKDPTGIARSRSYSSRSMSGFNDLIVRPINLFSLLPISSSLLLGPEDPTPMVRQEIRVRRESLRRFEWPAFPTHELRFDRLVRNIALETWAKDQSKALVESD